MQVVERRPLRRPQAPRASFVAGFAALLAPLALPAGVLAREEPLPPSTETEEAPRVLWLESQDLDARALGTALELRAPDARVHHAPGDRPVGSWRLVVRRDGSDLILRLETIEDPVSPSSAGVPNSRAYERRLEKIDEQPIRTAATVFAHWLESLERGETPEDAAEVEPESEPEPEPPTPPQPKTEAQPPNVKAKQTPPPTSPWALTALGGASIGLEPVPGYAGGVGTLVASYRGPQGLWLGPRLGLGVAANFEGTIVRPRVGVEIGWAPRLKAWEIPVVVSVDLEPWLFADLVVDGRRPLLRAALRASFDRRLPLPSGSPIQLFLGPSVDLGWAGELREEWPAAVLLALEDGEEFVTHRVGGLETEPGFSLRIRPLGRIRGREGRSSPETR